MYYEDRRIRSFVATLREVMTFVFWFTTGTLTGHGGRPWWPETPGDSVCDDDEVPS